MRAIIRVNGLGAKASTDWFGDCRHPEGEEFEANIIKSDDPYNNWAETEDELFVPAEFEIVRYL